MLVPTFTLLDIFDNFWLFCFNFCASFSLGGGWGGWCGCLSAKRCGCCTVGGRDINPKYIVKAIFEDEKSFFIGLAL